MERWYPYFSSAKTNKPLTACCALLGASKENYSEHLQGGE